ncbi:MAG: hypothetical protein ACRDDA_13285, partial [Aeromonas sp.]
SLIPHRVDQNGCPWAATAINNAIRSKSRAKAGLVADYDFDTSVDASFDAGWGVVRDMGWHECRLALSAAKPNM